MTIDTPDEPDGAISKLHNKPPKLGDCRRRVITPTTVAKSDNSEAARCVRPRAYSMHSKTRLHIDTTHNNDKSSRRSSLPASALIENFLCVPGVDNNMDYMDKSDESSGEEDHLRRARSLKGERSDSGREPLRRVRSFKTTSKGLINRGDSFKRRKNKSHKGFAVLDDGAECREQRNHLIPANACSPQTIPTVSIDTTGSLDQAPNYFRVLMLGVPGVGKTLLTDQFMTSEFLGNYEYSISKQTGMAPDGAIVNFLIIFMVYCEYIKEMPHFEDSLKHLQQAFYYRIRELARAFQKQVIWSEASAFQNLSQSEEDRTVTLLVDGDESTIEFLDNEGFEDELETFSLDGYVVVYSLTDKTSFETAVDILDSLRQEVGPEKAVILVANKSDLVRKRRVTSEDGRTTADKYGCKYIETSAALNHRVDELLVGVLKQILLKANGGPVEETLPNHSAKSIKAKDKDRKGSFKKTKQFLEKIFRRSGTKDKACENLYVD